MEEVSSKGTLSWYKLAKNIAGAERYFWSMQCQEVMSLQFRLKTGSAGLLEDKKRCKITICERCVIVRMLQKKMFSIFDEGDW